MSLTPVQDWIVVYRFQCLHLYRLRFHYYSCLIRIPKQTYSPSCTYQKRQMISMRCLCGQNRENKKSEERGRERGRVREWGRPHYFDPGQFTRIIAWKWKKQTPTESRYYPPLTPAILDVLAMLANSLLDKVRSQNRISWDGGFAPYPDDCFA